MSQPQEVVVEELEELEELSPDDRAWLDERLEEYRELLAYLRDH